MTAGIAQIPGRDLLDADPRVAEFTRRQGFDTEVARRSATMPVLVHGIDGPKFRCSATA